MKNVSISGMGKDVGKEKGTTYYQRCSLSFHVREEDADLKKRKGRMNESFRRNRRRR